MKDIVITPYERFCTQYTDYAFVIRILNAHTCAHVCGEYHVKVNKLKFMHAYDNGMLLTCIYEAMNSHNINLKSYL